MLPLLATGTATVVLWLLLLPLLLLLRGDGSGNADIYSLYTLLLEVMWKHMLPPVILPSSILLCGFFRQHPIFAHVTVTGYLLLRTFLAFCITACSRVLHNITPHDYVLLLLENVV